MTLVEQLSLALQDRYRIEHELGRGEPRFKQLLARMGIAARRGQ